MKIKNQSLILSMLFGLLFMPAVHAVEGVQSLRIGIEIDAPSATPMLYKWMHESTTIPRQYVQQPPLIPHRVDGYRITTKFNKCLTCHSWSNYKHSNATKISLTHFVEYNGSESANVAGRRYFCLQCHVPQMQVDPIVGNDFAPIEILDR